MKKLPLLFPLLLLAFCAGAVSMEGIDFFGGVLAHGNTVAESAPLPVLAHMGVGMPVKFNPYFSLRPTLSAYLMYYGYSPGIDHPLPMEKEKREMLVINLLLDPALQVSFPLPGGFELGFLVSPAFLFRIPAIAYDGKDELRGSMSDYFYGPGRYFFPGGGIYGQWKFSDSASLGIKGAAYLPVHHLINDDGISLFEEMLISVGATITLHLGDYSRRSIKKQTADEILEEVEAGREPEESVEGAK